MDRFREAQESFLNILQIIHRRTYNILSNYTNEKDVKQDIVKLLDFTFEEMRTIEKDIKISESAANKNSL